MMKPIRIYWGGDLFDHKDLVGNALLAEAVRELSCGRYLPCLPQESEVNQERMDIRDSDYNLLLTCDVMLANFDGPDLDSGTVAEFLFAKMLDYPALLLRTDFRKQSESASSPDPWNLMCSNFPRTKSRILHAMTLLGKFRTGSPEWITEYLRAIAAEIVADLDELCALTPVFERSELAGIYRNVIRATGGSLESVWPPEKLEALLAGKISRGIY